jgi:hypothetical protein
MSAASPRVRAEGAPRLGDSFDPLQRRADLVAEFGSETGTLGLIVCDGVVKIVARGLEELDRHR